MWIWHPAVNPAHIVTVSAAQVVVLLFPFPNLETVHIKFEFSITQTSSTVSYHDLLEGESQTLSARLDPHRPSLARETSARDRVSLSSVRQGVKLLGLLLTGSTGQHMAGRNGLA
jgi:hypothetical protein